MRTSHLLAVSLAAVLATAAMAPAAQAQTRVRISVNLGDVLYVSGHPYYRGDRSPVYVEQDRWGHRQYYRYAEPRRVVYVPAPYYANNYRPQPYYGHDDRWDRDHRHHDNGRHRGHDRDHDRDDDHDNGRRGHDHD